MAYKEKDTRKWSAQWFETNARGEKKKRRKRGFDTKKEALEYERQKKLSSIRSMDMKLSEFIPEFLKQELKDYVEGHYGMPENERLFPIVQEAVQHKMKHK